MTLYFAYGSNMCRAPMRARCPSAREVGVATLAGYRVIVTSDGYASVVPDAAGVVHGLVWRLAPRVIAALDAYESLDTGLYRVVTLPVSLGAGKVSAMVYVAGSRAPGLPRPGYLAAVLAAARELDFPAGYVAALARWQPARLRASRADQAGDAA